MKVAGNGDVYLTGGTTSNDMPSTSGAKFPTYYGGTDGFIARLNPSGVLQRVTYLGTGNMDMSFFIDIDKYGAVYAYGQTLGLWPTTPGTWSTTAGGQFVVKLSADLSQLIFSSKFGSANNFVNLVPTAFNVDECLNILLSGWGGAVNGGNLGGNTNNLPVTTDAVQQTTDGSDFYFLVLKQMPIPCSTPPSLGAPRPNTSMAAPPALRPMARFTRRFAPLVATAPSPLPLGLFPDPNEQQLQPRRHQNRLRNFGHGRRLHRLRCRCGHTLCDNLRVKFTNNSKNANQYFWNFGNGQTSTAKEPTVIFTKGVWDIKLIAIDTVRDIMDSTTIQITHNQGIFPEPKFSTEYFSCDRLFEVKVFNESIDSEIHEWRFGNSALSLVTPFPTIFSPGPAYHSPCGLRYHLWHVRHYFPSRPI